MFSDIATTTAAAATTTTTATNVKGAILYQDQHQGRTTSSSLSAQLKRTKLYRLTLGAEKK
jgi:hypothetical protein